MESVIATREVAAVGVSGVHAFGRSFIRSARARHGFVPVTLSTKTAKKFSQRMEVRAQKSSHRAEIKAPECLKKLGRMAILFLGLAAGLNSCRFANAHEVTVTTTTTEEIIEDKTQGKSSEDINVTTTNKEVGTQEEDRKRTTEEETEMLDQLTMLHEEMEKRNMPVAIDLLAKIIEKNPTRLEFRYIRGHAYEYIGDLDNALNEFEQALKIEPLSVRGLQGKALMLKKQGKDIESIQKIVEDTISKLTEEEKLTEARNYQMLLGQILTLKDDLSEALKLYEQISKEDPEDFRPYLCRGLVCCMMGNLQEAEKHFSNFEKYCPPFYEAKDIMEDLIKNARAEATKRGIQRSSK